MKVEILTIHDPDGGPESVLFVDGERVDDAHEEVVDPGRGYDVSDWDEATDWVTRNRSLSKAFRAAVLEARAAGRESKYVEKG